VVLKEGDELLALPEASGVWRQYPPGQAGRSRLLLAHRFPARERLAIGETASLCCVVFPRRRRFAVSTTAPFASPPQDGSGDEAQNDDHRQDPDDPSAGRHMPFESIVGRDGIAGEVVLDGWTDCGGGPFGVGCG